MIKNLSTAMLAFVAGKFDMTFPYRVRPPLLRDVTSQMPQAIYELAPIAIHRDMIINRHVPPFDNPDLRHAMALSLDRKAFIDIITEARGDIGGVMQPPPEGLWGMPPDRPSALAGYDPDVQENGAETRRIMNKVGYGPDNQLKVRLTVRDLPYGIRR